MERQYAKLVIRVFILLMVIFLLSCAYVFADDSTESADYANSITNSYKNVDFISSGDLVFYINDEYKLIKYNLITNESSALHSDLRKSYSNSPFDLLCIYQERIYLMNEYDIYSMKLDGTDFCVQKTADLLNIGTEVIFKDKHFYYIDGGTEFLKRLSIDSGNESSIVKGCIESYCLDGNYAYYSIRGNIIRINLVTGQTEWLLYHLFTEQMFIKDNYIYIKDMNSIFRVDLRKHMKELEKVADAPGGRNISLYYSIKMVYYDEWIYYFSYNEKISTISRVAMDGKNNKVITEVHNHGGIVDHNNSNFNVANGWIFYREGQNVYKVKIDGTDKQKLD